MTEFFSRRPDLLILLSVFALSTTSTRIFAQSDKLAPLPKSPEATSPSNAESKKFDLRYKLNRGDVLRYEVSHRASIQSTIEQSTQAAQTKTDSIKGWKVTDVLPDGEIEFMNVVERVTMVNQLPERDPVEYDSERDKTPPPGFEDAAKSIGVPLSVIRITPRGKITRRDAKLGQLRLDDDAPIVVRLPEEPVAIGATWDEPFDIKLELQGGATRSVQTRRHHKLGAVKGDIATIEVTYQVLTPVDAAQEAQLVERMMSGEVQFNIATGRVVGQQMGVDKRILGFAGPTSSLQYVMKMEEKLLDPAKKVADKPPIETSPSVASLPPGAPRPPGTTEQKKSADATPVKEPTKTVTAPRRQTRPSRTAKRPRPAPQGGRGYVR